MTRVIGRLYPTHKKLLLTKAPSTEFRTSETAEEEIQQQAEQVCFRDLHIVPTVAQSFIFVLQRV